jgi:outer membrane protein assembly factor BamA
MKTQLSISLIFTALLMNKGQSNTSASDSVQRFEKATTDFLPIVSYDTDAGFGYGVKSFFLNHLHYRESFDVVLFNSTKGERWYRLVFSIPDFEARQGTEYPLAVDVVFDYDKWISYSFFGVGNSSRFDDREYYTREPFEVSVTANRGFSSTVVGQIGMKHKQIKNYNFTAESRLVHLQPELNASTVTSTSLSVSLRYDTRNSYINPSEGSVLLGDVEIAPKWFANNVHFVRLHGTFQHYFLLFDSIVLATRASLQMLSGTDLPIQVLLPVGGGTTLRGFPQDRYLDKTAALVNAEVRFPIIWRIGGIIGFDMGRVWNEIREIDMKGWVMNGVFGLRFYFDTFIARADVGISNETTGFYLNFGQVF